MTRGFVFGKFLPFHKGHKALIRFASTKCDHLTVLICVSDHEAIPGEIRKNWIEESFPNHHQISIRIFNYKETDLPNTSETSKEVSLLWADVFRRELPGHDLLVTSEPYGDLVSRLMNIRHIPFDPRRQQQPISASIIRQDIFRTWHWLPDAVKKDLAIKVVLLGTESTGKSTLTQKIAHYYNCTAVMEAARDIIDNSNHFTLDDLYQVAEVHAQRILEAVIGESPMVIIDTDIHITMSYAKLFLRQNLELDQNIIQANKACLHLYLDNDMEFIQDGTRLQEEAAYLLDKSHQEVLQTYGVDLTKISGNWDEKFQQAITCIDTLITEYPNRFRH